MFGINKLQSYLLILSVSALLLNVGCSGAIDQSTPGENGTVNAPLINQAGGGLGAQVSGGGTGYDGKIDYRFVKLGQCSDGLPEAIIGMNATKTAAWTLRENCMTLATPRPIQISLIDIHETYINYGGSVYISIHQQNTINLTTSGPAGDRMTCNYVKGAVTGSFSLTRVPPSREVVQLSYSSGGSSYAGSETIMVNCSGSSCSYPGTKISITRDLPTNAISGSVLVQTQWLSLAPADIICN